MKKILAVIGARPQFIKHAPVEIELSKYFDVVTVHTGQHYDTEMSNIFFDELKISTPKYILKVGSESQSIQTAKMMIDIDRVIIKESPDFVLVYGDTTSTLAGALCAAKLNIKLIHIEAGLRSFNRSMPEEINRVVTDHISDLLFAPSDTAVENLHNENITKNVYKTGDVMCDLLFKMKDYIKKSNENGKYYYATLHRPYNVDDLNRLLEILNALNNLDKNVIFSVHPRTKSKLIESNTDINSFDKIRFIKPVSYVINLQYMYNSLAVFTDSGGMQKEAYLLKKKCITIRSETEWVETLNGGWNTLVFNNFGDIKSILHETPVNYNPMMFGDGCASEYICKKIIHHI